MQFKRIPTVKMSTNDELVAYRLLLYISTRNLQLAFEKWTHTLRSSDSRDNSVKTASITHLLNKTTGRLNKPCMGSHTGTARTEQICINKTSTIISEFTNGRLGATTVLTTGAAEHTNLWPSRSHEPHPNIARTVLLFKFIDFYYFDRVYFFFQ